MATGGKRDPSSHRTPEQIKKMDRGYNAQPHKIKHRSMNNQARATIVKEKGAQAVKGKDVDHKKMLKDGGSNARGNLRVQTQHKNRGWRRDK